MKERLQLGPFHSSTSPPAPASARASVPATASAPAPASVQNSELGAQSGAENAAEAMELAWTNKHVKYFRVRGAPPRIGSGNGDVDVDVDEVGSWEWKWGCGC